MADFDATLDELLAGVDVDQQQKIKDVLHAATKPELTRMERYLIWFFGTLVASVTPIVCAAIVSGSWAKEIYNGQLLICAVGVFGAAAAGSYVIQVERDLHRNMRTAVAVSAVPFIAASAILYQSFAGVVPTDADAHSDAKVATVSYVIGFFAVVSGLANTYLASEATR